MAESLNSLHVDNEGNTPESIMFGVDLDSILVKNFYTLFCPVYVLDHRLQLAGGPGPPKWEPRFQIGVYLGHSPFHAGSVALVFNPKMAKVSPQYHVFIDDDFSTDPYIEHGKVPPNWEGLYCLSIESVADESFYLALEWILGSSLMATKMDILFPYKIKFSTLSTLCLISTMLLRTVSMQISMATSALPLVQFLQESATACHRLSHSARLLQQSLCLTCHQRKEWGSKPIFWKTLMPKRWTWVHPQHPPMNLWCLNEWTYTS